MSIVASKTFSSIEIVDNLLVKSANAFFTGTVITDGIVTDDITATGNCVANYFQTVQLL